MRRLAVLTACLAAAPLLVHTLQRGAPTSLAWQAVGEGPMGGAVAELLESETGVLLARVDGTLYRSTDEGRSWRRCADVPAPSNRTQSPVEAPQWFRHTIAHRLRTERPGPTTQERLEVTDARCETFGTVAVPPWGGYPGDDLWILGGRESLVAVTPAGAFRSTDGGTTWARTLSVEGQPRVCATSRSRELLVVAGVRLYASTDAGATWSLVPEDPNAPTGAVSRGRSPRLGCPFIRSSNYHSVLAAGPDGVWWSYPGDAPEWTRIHDGRPSLIAATERRVWMVTTTPKGVGLMRSDDDGASWDTLPFPLGQEVRLNRLVDTIQGTVLAATSAGIYRSADRGESWVLTGVHPEAIALGSDRRHTYASDASGLWLTRNAGASWLKVTATIDGRRWTPEDRLSRVFDVSGRSAAVVNNRLFRVSDNGAVFTPAGLDKDVTSLVRAQSVWYASTEEGVFRSADFSSWVECSLGLFASGPLVVLGRGDLLKGAAARSTDGCRSWWPFETEQRPRGLPFMFGGDDHVVAMGAGIARLDLRTRAWTYLKDGTELQVTSVAVDDRGRYWIGTAHGVYGLLRDGHGWDVFPMGLQYEQIHSLTIDRHGYLIAATHGRGLLRAALP